MDGKPNPSAIAPWYAPWRHEVNEDDAADLGTAFGMELSFGPAQDFAPTAAEPSAAKSWMKKLQLGRKL